MQTAVLSSARPRHWLLLFGLLVYTVCFLALYPPTFAIVDEDAYLTQAFLFRSGRLSYNDSPIPAPHMTVAPAGRAVSKYPPGNALFLLPFTLAGWRWVFVSGLVLALAGTLLFAATLRRLCPEAGSYWALLYLCYPTVVVYSRTVMSDLLAATLVLAAFYCLLRGWRWLLVSGLALGAACLVRYSNAVLVPVFVLLAWLRAERGKGLLRLGLGLVPAAFLIFGYNSFAFGGPFRFPMQETGAFRLSFAVHNLNYYVSTLLLWYPLLLVAPFAAGRRRRLLLGLPVLALLVLFALFSYTYPAGNVLERVAVGLRYLLPALPFLLLAYVLALHELGRLLPVPAVRPLLLALVLAVSIAVQVKHDRYLHQQLASRRTLYAVLPEDGLLACNKDMSELISYVWGWREHVGLGALAPDSLPAERSLFAGWAELPGRTDTTGLGSLEARLALFPRRSVVLDTFAGRRLRLWRLNPSP
ncbi:MAG: glycosyltransferase family 39 protein [candidate division WOR-3 bacterium]